MKASNTLEIDWTSKLSVRRKIFFKTELSTNKIWEDNFLIFFSIWCFYREKLFNFLKLLNENNAYGSLPHIKFILFYTLAHTYIFIILALTYHYWFNTLYIDSLITHCIIMYVYFFLLFNAVYMIFLLSCNIDVIISNLNGNKYLYIMSVFLHTYNYISHFWKTLFWRLAS